MQFFESSFTLKHLLKVSVMIKRNFIYLSFFLLLILQCSSPNEPAKKGFTAKEAEQLASTRALELMQNPLLVSMETPEDGGGLNREGRLAKGENGKWIFGYFTPGSSQALLIEVISTKARDYSVTFDNLKSLQEILPEYIDSSDAMEKAEKHGGKDLTDVNTIICTLLGEPIWPTGNPKKVAWEVLYKMKNGSKKYFYIEAYSGVYLGDG